MLECFYFPLVELLAKIREGGRQWKLIILDSKNMIHRSVFSCDSPHELLLRVQMGIPGERDYYDSVDLVWDISKECTTWALRQRVASHYCLPVDKIEIAKYFPEKFEWLPISSWVRSGMTESSSYFEKCTCWFVLQFFSVHIWMHIFIFLRCECEVNLVEVVYFFKDLLGLH